MTDLKKENLNKLHNIMLDILTEVDKICIKHNIEYWLDSGTLLGAVRHKGFIPWDDDLDISMTLEDYYRFLNIVQEELPSHMKLQTAEIEKGFPYDFAKIRDSRGTLIEKHEIGKTISYNQGVFIDIIPVIKIDSSLYSKYKYKFLFSLIQLFSYNYLNLKLIRNLLINQNDKSNKKSNSIMIRSGKFPSSLCYVDTKSVFPLVKIEFNGKSFFSPKNAHTYLLRLYGKDYMVLPPVEQRHTHADTIEIYEE